jgi:uncharacterized membrane protein
MTSNHRNALIFVAFLALLLVAQFALASQRSFWEDEALTARLSAQSFSEIVEQRAQNNHPPLYWLLASVWGKTFGFDEIGLRSFSILCLGMVLALLYKLSRLLFNARVAWMAGLLLVASPYVLTYGHNARYYALAAALSLLAVLAAYLYFKEHRLWTLVIYSLSAVGLIYTIYMGATVLLGINLWLLLQALRRKVSPGYFVIWLGAQVLIVASYLPWLANLAASAGRNLDPAFSLSGFPAAFALRLGYLGFAYSVGEFFSPLHPLVWLGILLTLLLLLSALRRLDHPTGLLFSVLGVVVLGSLLVSIVSVFPQSAWQNLSNRNFFAYPCFVLLLAVGLDRLRSRQAQILLALLVVVYLAGSFNVYTGRQAVKPLLIVPWVQVMEKIQTESQPEAVVFCSQFDTVCPYYVNRYGLKHVALSGWEQALDVPPPEVWWLQNNIGGYDYQRDQEQAAFQALQGTYQQVEQYDYGAQDESIRWIKSRWLGQDDYPYRLNLYQFNQPLR